jgi:hypothetical protein
MCAHSVISASALSHNLGVDLLGAGLKGSLKRPGKFHMRYPRKHQNGIDNGPMQHSGATQRQEDTIADDGDINMAVD